MHNERWEPYANNNSYEGKGLGDIVIYGRYWLWPYSLEKINPYVEVSLGTPTGDDDETYIKRGTTNRYYKKPYIQPGLGVWAPSLALGFDKPFSKEWSIYGRAQYIWTIGKNDAEYSPSNPLFTSLGTQYKVRFGKDALMGLSFQVNYLYDNWEKEHGVSGTVQSHTDVEVGNTGGQWLDVEPGIWFSPDNGRFVVSISVPVNVWYEVNSLQTNAPWMLHLGVSYRF